MKCTDQGRGSFGREACQDSISGDRSESQGIGKKDVGRHKEETGDPRD